MGRTLETEAQFVILGEDRPVGGKRHALDTVRVDVFPGLNVVKVCDRTGQTIDRAMGKLRQLSLVASRRLINVTRAD